MLTGDRLFQGETMADLLAASVMQEPDLDRARAKVRRLFKRCLEKDSKKRLRDIGDAMPLLEDAPAPAAASTATVPLRSRFVWPTAFAAVAIPLVALAFVHFREKAPTPPEPAPVAEHVASSGSAGWFSVSSNGTLAYRTGARDLKRFLLAVLPGGPEKPELITVVLNWESALNKK